MNRKVEHLPNVKRQLETLVEKIEKEIQVRQYERALEKIAFLEEQQFFYPSIYKHKLFCLTRLERWDEVESIAESLLSNHSDPFIADYVLYYVTSLYHRQQYHLVIEFINERKWEEIFTNEDHEYLTHLYSESEQKNSEKIERISEKLQLAIITKNETEQWRLLNQWKLLSAPPSELIYQMLSLPEVDSFVKTNILSELQDRKINRQITIMKKNQKLTVNVLDLHPLREHPFYVDTLQHLEDIEQNDPTLYSLVLELIQRYFEDKYPFFAHDDSKFIAEAAKSIAKNHLTGKTSISSDENEMVFMYKKQIEMTYEAFLRLTIT